MNVYKQFEPRVRELRERYEKFLPASFFILGLVFDIFTTGRIDHWITLVQQGVYLVIIILLLISEVLELQGPLPVPAVFQKIWKYREEAVHFLFGSLLSTFVIFYFKSASILNSFLFLSLIITLLVLNEFARFKGLGFFVRFALYSLCLCSYFAYLVPILLGWVGLFPFLVAIAVSALIFGYVVVYLRGKNVERDLLIKKIARPAFAIQVLFLILYVFALIPPVPLSLNYIGIYHKIDKQGGKFFLHYTRPWWKFWEHGAQTFSARPGDRIYTYAQVFSPTGFKDQIKVRWLYKEKKGWNSWDAIPLDISGGREEGFRGFAFKENYQPGQWRVQIETTDGREIGRISFEVEADQSQEERVLETEVR